MTVRKFVDSRKEMRMENQKEKSNKKEKGAEICRKASYKNVVIVLAVVLVIASWGNWTAQCNHIGEQD